LILIRIRELLIHIDYIFIMKLSQFRYNLPQELIALYPSENRDGSRVLIVNRKSGEIQHKIFKDITEYFKENDVLVFNNTKGMRLKSFC
jgi:S-adenosylmethionine:tRNA ribosyltransferase-isomerase